jgi:uncharacterized protein YodC (DUF2158 family)
MQSGSLVRLKSGGPTMTIGWIGNTEAECNWFSNDDDLKSAVFKVAQLETVDDVDDKN